MDTICRDGEHEKVDIIDIDMILPCPYRTVVHRNVLEYPNTLFKSCFPLCSTTPVILWTIYVIWNSELLSYDVKHLGTGPDGFTTSFLQEWLWNVRAALGSPLMSGEKTQQPADYSSFFKPKGKLR